MKGKLRAAGLILSAGVISFLVFGIWLLLLTLLLEYFKWREALEAQLLTDFFLKPIALVLLASWVLLSGLFLKRPHVTKWGRSLLYIYFAVCVLPYFLSFTVNPSF